MLTQILHEDIPDAIGRVFFVVDTATNARRPRRVTVRLCMSERMLCTSLSHLISNGTKY